MNLDAALPLLVSSYQRGGLVPFLGSGMSYPVCVSWPALVTNLEKQASGQSSRTDDDGPDDLVRRANAAVGALKLRGREAFEDAVSKALGGDFSKLPPATEELARLYWPLVLTTNYDDLFRVEWNDVHGSERSLEVLGRHPRDCQRVLEALHAPMPPCLWALQGFIGGQHQEIEERSGLLRRFITGLKRGPARSREAFRLAERHLLPDEKPLLLQLFQGRTALDRLRLKLEEAQNLLGGKRAELRSQLVVGHEEYRRVTYLEPVFRRAFAEVYRSRSLLFLGSGLAEQYLLNLFSEVLETFGPNPVPHYAFMKKGEIKDLEFLRSRFNTFVVEFDEFAQLPEWLRRLTDACQRPPARPTGWTFQLPMSTIGRALRAQSPVLEVVSEGITSLTKKECVVVAVAGTEQSPPVLSEQTQKRLQTLVKKQSDGELNVEVGRLIVHYKDLRAFGLRYGLLRKDLQSISAAIDELLDEASKHKYACVHLALDAYDGARIDKRFGLNETVRALGRWFRERRKPASVRRFVIHVENIGLLFDLRAGRIDVPRLLSHQDLLFWLSVDLDDGQSSREPVHTMPDASVLDLAEIRQIKFENDERWCVEVDPPPTGEVFVRSLARLQRAGDVRAATLAGLGVAPGSTLRFFRARVLGLPTAEAKTAPARKKSKKPAKARKSAAKKKKTAEQ